MRREFFAERYPRPMWDRILGAAPFIVRGPKLEEGILLAEDFDMMPDDPRAREIIADMLLQEGAVQAAWATEMRQFDPKADRHALAVRQLASELPLFGFFGHGWSPGVVDYLEGVPPLSLVREHLADDQVRLEVICTYPA